MKIIEITDEHIKFNNDNLITYDHDQDCCEENYADFKQIDDFGKDYAFFEDLGSYTLLHLIKDTSEAKYFMQNYLEKLITYSNEQNMNLFKTLRVYIEQNGSI